MGDISEETKKRLESIVESCKNIDASLNFHKNIGNKEKATEFQRKKLEEELLKLSKNPKDYEIAYQRLNNAEKLELSLEEQKKLARQIFEGKHYNSRILLSIAERYLDVSEEEKDKLKLDILSTDLGFGVANDEDHAYNENVVLFEGYRNRVKQLIDELKANKEVIKKSVQCAYDKFMIGLNNGPSRDELFRASFLAREYLDREKVLKAGKLLMKSHTAHGIWADGYKRFRIEKREFDLPDEITRPVAIYYFLHYAGWRDDAKKIKKENNLTDEELIPGIQKKYKKNRESGSYESMTSLRENYSFAFENFQEHLDNLEDLKLLAQILKKK